jgi:hypothetical protein
MRSTASPSNKIYPERAMPATTGKPSTMAPSSQQSPSRPSSAAPHVKADKIRAKTPLAASENIAKIRDGNPGSSLSPDTLADSPVQTNMTISLEHVNTTNHAMRGPPGAPANPGFMPPPFFNAGMNMNVAHQQGYGPSPQLQFYAPNFNPNGYTQAASTTRPGSAIQKYQNMDPKFPPAPNQMVHSSAPPQHPSNMTRRPSSNYFVPPTMSPVQTSYGPRGWIPNGHTMLGGPMAMHNGNAGMQNPAMYQPAMLPGNGNPALLTPPGGVQPNFSPAFAPQSVPNQQFGYPTPPEATGLVAADIPPPIPSVYPDPAYSNINNCIYNPKGTTNVYIRGLRPETTDEDLLHMVRQYGTIESTKAIIDTQTKSCKGYIVFLCNNLT